MVKTYHGVRTRLGIAVMRNGEPLDLRLDLRNHSPTGFEWGYMGSGPSQLALAILTDCCGETIALDYYQQFKCEVVANFPGESWTLSEQQIGSWLAENMPPAEVDG